MSLLLTLGWNGAQTEVYLFAVLATNKCSECRHMSIPMNYVKCSNWKEASAGWTMLCDIMQKLKMRLYCVVKDKQPVSLLTILAFPHHGSMSSIVTFNKPDNKPPSPDIFIPPNDCRSKNAELVDWVDDFSVCCNPQYAIHQETRRFGKQLRKTLQGL